MESARIGPYEQPEWTMHRRFITTRGYVLPPWQVSAELGYDIKSNDEGDVRHRLTQEIELGLPYRFQLDYEARGATETGDAAWRFDSQSVELRWALADWDVIPTNPTVFAEWTFNDHEADAYEMKLLLADELGLRWHWGVNLFFEQMVGGEREREVAGSGALSYSLWDGVLGIGAEAKLTAETANEEDYATFLQLGPSLQWRIGSHVHFDVAPLFGIGHEAPPMQVFALIGVDFFPSEYEREATEPASLRGR